ncbi:MAG: DUF2294 domain-containing protein [Planctomycetia bacterium]|nr:DUF2294 domain-containing protein [Planctomycetia bacterium]
MTTPNHNNGVLTNGVQNGNGNGRNSPPGRPRTRGEVEAALSRAFIQLEKECTGRGPTETRTFLIEDVVLVRLKGVMTPAEIKLSGADQRGAYLIKQTRQELTNVKRPQMEDIVKDLLGAQLRSLHTDICTRTGERVVVLSLDRRPEFAAEKGEAL